MYYAHGVEGRPPAEWEPLYDHLKLVAGGGDTLGASDFAEAFGAADWGHLLGLWHDLGKYSRDFQEYLRAVAAPGGGSAARVDHSSCGAQHAATLFPDLVGRLLAYCIAGHHGGLPDYIGGSSGLEARLTKRVCDYSAAPNELSQKRELAKPPQTWDHDGQARAFQLSIFCRMLFSCLVDADFLATESFMRPDQAAGRRQAQPALAELALVLDEYLASKEASSPDTPVNHSRREVLRACRAAASLPSGFFSLTVPTGGGKTLSSLAFALAHARQHGLRRVIYAIPFTSIIEQNAEVFRAAFGRAGRHVVLEHHSNFEPPKTADAPEDEAQTPWHRLAAENWDTPLVVTTNVQFFESLFACKPSRCRKLHRIARSVIILDECQTLPVTLLKPTLRMLDELCRNYGCTVVLCSATQPAVQHRDDFRIGLTGVREIVSEPLRLYESLRRVEVERLGELDDAGVIDRLRQHEQVLCVVNTRGHAARLFTALRASPEGSAGVFHLSAQMCAAHRTDVLARIRKRLDPDNPRLCQVVSTQLIEAGVDVDFPVVFRAMTGLDSVAQAAGRCNREGRLQRGKVFVFDTDVDPRGDLRSRRQIAAEVAPLHDDLLGLDALEHFFRLNYWSRKDDWDQQDILGAFKASAGLCFQFRAAAEKYRLIPDTQKPVIVPYGRHGRRVIAQLSRLTQPPGRTFDRRLQRYTVGVYEQQFNQLRDNQSVALYHERFWVLENENAYHRDLGLLTDTAGFNPAHLLI
jgi:CRISPR-associated endonuclease/helicase Cas3